jgi:hypothetical protein
LDLNLLNGKVSLFARAGLIAVTYGIPGLPLLTGIIPQRNASSSPGAKSHYLALEGIEGLAKHHN